MTTAEDLVQEFMDFIKNKRDELTVECDEVTAPFLKTIAEPTSKDEEEYAQNEFNKILEDKNACDILLDEIEDLLNEQ